MNEKLIRAPPWIIYMQKCLKCLLPPSIPGEKFIAVCPGGADFYRNSHNICKIVWSDIDVNDSTNL